MRVVHNPDQIMAWKPADIAALIGKHVSIRAAADPSYWSNPHTYAGPWDELASGVVAAAEIDAMRELGRVTYTDGSSTYWVAGQPVYITVTD